MGSRASKSPRSSSPTATRPKQKNRVKFMPRANERKVDYVRDIPASLAAEVPQRVKNELAAKSIEHTAIREQLDVLRKTRGQRRIEPLRVPAHLRDAGAMMVLDDSGVEKRADIPRGSSE